MDGVDAFKARSTLPHPRRHPALSQESASAAADRPLRIPFFLIDGLPIAVTACRDIAEILVARGRKKS